MDYFDENYLPGLTLPRRQLLAKAEQAGRLLLANKDVLGLQAIVVFGSLARGEADYRSDVDIMAIVDGGPAESSKAKDYILGHFYNEFESEWPRVDTHTCCTEVYYGDQSRFDGTPFGDFLTCVKQDGVAIWEK